MPPATIRDVAKQAGVGIGTVSRVLNNHPSVSASARERVEDAIVALQYRPNPIARQLSMGKSSSVAVMAPFFIRPSFVERLRGIEAVLSSHKFDLVLYNVETAARREELYQVLPRGELFNGLIILTLGPRDQEADLLLASGMPVVLIDAHHSALSRVTTDDVYGGYLAIQHVLGLGHTRIAYISDTLESPYRLQGASLYRYKGYRQALDEAGIPFRDEYYRQGQHGVEEAKVMAHALLALEEPPTAIFAASDTQAIGVLHAAAESGFSVPEDLSVVGFDDIEVAQYLNLTTIRQPLFDSGVEGANLLIRCMNAKSNGQAATEVRLPLELVKRRTTAPPRA